MPKAKEKPLIQRFLPYMGKKKALLPLSLILSGVSAVLNILPFVLIWYIVRDILQAPQTIDIARIGTYAWYAFGCAFGGVLLYFCALMSSHLAAFHVEVGTAEKTECVKSSPCRLVFSINMPAASSAKSSTTAREQRIRSSRTSFRTWPAASYPPLFSSRW